MRAILLAAILGLSSPAFARIDPATFSSFAFRQHPGAQLPIDASFVDEQGRSVTLAEEIAGRPAIVVLEYLRCQNLCSLVLSGAVSALGRAKLTPGKDLSLIALSIDPRDTPKESAAAQGMYSRRFADPLAASHGIHFLTGSEGEVKRVADAVGFPYRPDQVSGQIAHPAGFVVITPAGKISRYILGASPAPAALGKALGDASLGQVTPAVHPLLLLCFGYDPDEASAAALALKLVRIASFAVVLLLAGLVAILSLRRRTA